MLIEKGASPAFGPVAIVKVTVLLAKGSPLAFLTSALTVWLVPTFPEVVSCDNKIPSPIMAAPERAK